ncbi:hypothetical protein [Sphingobacterium sp. IITKGP-BTPF85]|uniref:hypothetical protein n=1 Tax=Sphingobacterium sp. IITKGP-BTPF85 TaxID=1338009 RepID=UPI000419D8E7|nr:hypothetical protein [Sphingobacterium sp. IITKGP-BTPF85]
MGSTVTLECTYARNIWFKDNLFLAGFWSSTLIEDSFGGFRFKGRRGDMCHGHDFNNPSQQFSDEDRSRFKAEWKRRFSAACHDRNRNDDEIKKQ